MNKQLTETQNLIIKKMFSCLVSLMFLFNIFLSPIAIAGTYNKHSKIRHSHNLNKNKINIEPSSKSKVVKKNNDNNLLTKTILINKVPHKVPYLKPELKFSASPTDLEISTARVFLESIIPMQTPKTKNKISQVKNEQLLENKTLAYDLMYFQNNEDEKGLKSLNEFITKYPDSKWTPGLEVNLASIDFEHGYFSTAMKLLLDAWNKAKNQTSANPKLVADMAIANLLDIDAKIGRIDDVKNLLKQIKTRKFKGVSGTKIKDAKDCLWAMENSPATSFQCGPYAVNTILALRNKSLSCSQLTHLLPSTKQGTNLYEVQELAKKCNMPMLSVKIKPGVSIPIPSVMHWKVGHYAAIVNYDNGKYQIKDPTFGLNNNFWIARQVLDSEASGYFLIMDKSNVTVKDNDKSKAYSINPPPALAKTKNVAIAQLPTGISLVNEDEAKTIWGKGRSTGRNPAKTPSNPPQCPNAINCGCNGMAQVSAFSMQASLNVMDTPLSYTPPIGPKMDFTLNYNDGEMGQPQLTPSFSYFGSNWSFNYVAYLTIDSSNNVTVNPPGGGIEVYNYNMPQNLTNPYSPDVTSQAVLTLVDPQTYTRTLTDGSIEIYSNVNNTGKTQRIFLSQIIDPHGNAVTIKYMSSTNFQIDYIQDALGQRTTVIYEGSNISDPEQFYAPKIITDPFGRPINFFYDSTYNYLETIVDVINIASKFNYDFESSSSGSSMVSLTTPYGTTAFSSFTPPALPGQQYLPVGLAFYFPDKTSSVIENYVGETKTTYFWDRQATANYPQDYLNNNFTHCKITKWLFYSPNSATLLEEPVINYEQGPGLAPTFYTYAGQNGNSDALGINNKPITITRNINSPAAMLSLNIPQEQQISVGDSYIISMASNAYTSSNNLMSVGYTVVNGDTVNSIMSNLANIINNNKALNVNALANGQNLILNSTLNVNASYSPITYMGITNINNQFAIYMNFTNPSSNVNINATQFAGAVTPGDIVEFTVHNASLSGGSVTVSHTVASNDTLASIANAIANLINANTALQGIGVSAQSGNNAIMSLFSLSAGTTYSSSVSGSGSEKIITGFTQGQSITTTLGGSTNTNDVITLTATNVNTSQSINYTVASGDNANTIMANIANLVNNSTNMTNLGIVAQVNANTPTMNLTSNAGNIVNLDFTVSAGGSETFTNAAYYVPAQVYQYSYNSAGNVTQSIDPIGRTFNYFYDANNIDLLEVRVTKGSNNYLIGKWIYQTTNHPVNNQHIPLFYIDGSGQTTSYAYNSYGQILKVTDPLGNATNYNYGIISGESVPAYLTSVDGPMTGSSDLTSYTYDGAGRLQTKTNSQGYTITYAYDNANRPTQTTYPNGTSETIGYANLDAVVFTDRLNRSSTREYNSMDQLVKEIDPMGKTTTYTWCTCGSISSMTDANNNTTQWHHDLNGRLITKTMADGTQINCSYDAIGRKASRTDALNQTTFYSYNLDNTVDNVNYFNAINTKTPPVFYTYDPNFKRLTSAKNAWGSNGFTYNNYTTDPYATPILGGGKVASVTNSVIANATTTYSYDALGRVTNRSINGSANSANYSYDAMSRITSSAYTGNTGNNFGTFNYNYVDDISGNSRGDTRLASISYPVVNATPILTTNFNYLPNADDERLANINNVNTNSQNPNTKYQVLSNYSYAYDNDSEITNWQEQNTSNKLSNFNYDNDGEVISTASNYGSLAPPVMNQNYYNYDNVFNRTSKQYSSVQVINLTGSITASDKVTVTINDASLSTNPTNVIYTVQSTDTLATVAQNLSAAITNATYTSGISAVPVGNGIHIRSSSNYITSYSIAVSSGATIIATLGANNNATALAQVTGNTTANDVLNIIVIDPGLTNGSVTVSYTVQSGALLPAIANGLASAINSNVSLQTLGVKATSNTNSSIFAITSASPNTTTYNQSSSNSSGSGYASELVSFNINPNSQTSLVFTGLATAGDNLTVNVYDPSPILANGSVSIPYTVASGDSLTRIATNIANLINSNTSLNTLGVSAISSNATILLNSQSINKTTYAASGVVSGTNTITESMFIWQNNNATQSIVINGTVTAGNYVYVTTYNNLLSGNPGQEIVNYQVSSGQTLAQVASGLASAINSDSNLQAINVTAIAVNNIVYVTSNAKLSTTYNAYTSPGSSITATIPGNINARNYAYNNVNEITAIGQTPVTVSLKGRTNTAVTSTNTITPNTGSNPGIFITNQEFTVKAPLSVSNNLTTTTATYGKPSPGTTNASACQIQVTSPSAINPSYDVNGNLLNDGVNTYSYDVENRLVSIQESSGNVSNITYDALGHEAIITESLNGTVTSTKQFIWCGNTRCEVRDASSNLSNQYFAYGQVNFTKSGTTATNYYYTRDSLGSIREVTDANGNIVSQYNYTVFGQAVVTNGINGQAPSVTSDFGYAGYYYHKPSGLNLTLNRAYSASLGRWLTRDPIGERGGINLYGYVGNDPVSGVDPSGLWPFAIFSPTLDRPITGFQWYENWGGPSWANGSKTSEIDLFPHLLSDPLFQRPTNMRDYCYYAHDICLHNQSGILDDNTRQNCRKNCDRKLAGCLSGVPSSFWDLGGDLVKSFEINLFNGNFGASPSDNQGENPLSYLNQEIYPTYTPQQLGL